ncbi:MAG: RNA polymerase sigma factor [Gaiellaceae bacterium]|jgi:RNA polymerase sigma-70 factor (ECF subfamily)
MTATAAALPLAPGDATIQRVNNDVSDGELITRVGSGDRNAFETLYRRYARPVFGLALRRLGDRGRAEDAVQETFASVWRAARSYRPERGPGAPWLYAVARNAIVDNGRVRREPPVDSADERSDDETPADRAESGWVAWRVHRSIAELPDNERIVIELAYWGGRSQSEIADLLNVPLGTVKTRTRTGLARLADMLEDVL